MPIKSRLVKIFNAFRFYDQNPNQYSLNVGPVTNTRAYTPRRRYTSERTIISSIYTRISVDFAGIEIRHILVNDSGKYLKKADSDLSKCLSIKANIDQGPRALRQDIALTLFDEGVSALVPVDTTIDPETEKLLDIQSLRVGKIVQWYPKHVRVLLYNEEKGYREEIIVDKKTTAIIDNPFYEIMNAPNSTLQRLTRKLHLLDDIDEQSASGKLDIIIQLPYVVKTEQMAQRAAKRKEDIEFQLKDSQYGIAYVDGTEKITQLNRPAENNLLEQVKYLKAELYTQLGLTEEIVNGTADEKTMTNYYNRVIEPLLDATVEAMQRAFLGVEGTENKEQIKFFRNPFKLIPLSELAPVIDKVSRNEILTPNDIRDVLGLEPSSDPRADQLMNSNMPQKFPTPGPKGNKELQPTQQS